MDEKRLKDQIEKLLASMEEKSWNIDEVESRKDAGDIAEAFLPLYHSVFRLKQDADNTVLEKNNAVQILKERENRFS